MKANENVKKSSFKSVLSKAWRLAAFFVIFGMLAFIFFNAHIQYAAYKFGDRDLLICDIFGMNLWKLASSLRLACSVVTACAATWSYAALLDVAKFGKRKHVSGEKALERFVVRCVIAITTFFFALFLPIALAKSSVSNPVNLLCVLLTALLLGTPLALVGAHLFYDVLEAVFDRAYKEDGAAEERQNQAIHFRTETLKP